MNNINLIKKIKEMDRNKKILLVVTVIGICALLITLITTSYAMLSKTGSSEEKDLFESGDMIITFAEEEDSAININPAIPVTDEYGLTLKPYKFTITNTGSYKGCYTINLVENAETTISLDNVKYSIDGNDPKLLSERDGQILLESCVRAGKSRTYELRLWIKEEAEKEISGQVYSGKVSALGKAEKVKTVTGEYNIAINDLYYGALDGLKILGNSVQKGTNLFDVQTVTEGYYYDTSGNYVANASNFVSDYISVEELKGYRVRGKNMSQWGNIIRIYYFNSDKEWQSQSSFSVGGYGNYNNAITIPSGISYIRISGAKVNKQGNIYVYETVGPTNPIEIKSVGNLITEGENAGKYEIPIKVGGKNLYDGQMKQGAYLAASGNFSGITTYITNTNPIQVKENTNYTISRTRIDGDTTSYSQHALFYDKNNNYLGYLSIDNNETFMSLENAKYMYINIYGGGVNITPESAGTIQIEEGSTATDYEAYVEPKTYSIYLDEPLRYINNNYGKFYDYIDMENGILYRYVYKYVVTGNENFEVNGDITNSYKYNWHFISLGGSCTHYMQVSSNSSTTAGIYLAYTSWIIITDLNHSTADSFNEWTLQQYNAGTPITVNIVRLDQTVGNINNIVPIVTEEIVEIPDIDYNAGTNVITIDTDNEDVPATLELTY